MLGVAVIWGLNLPLMKAAFSSLTPLAFNALRYPLAAVLLSLTARAVEGPAPAVGSLRSFALLGLVGHAGYQYFFITGLDRTTAGNSGLILATAPLLIAVVAVMLGVERPAPRVWLGLIVAFLGLATLVHARGGATFRWTTVVGDMLTLVSALCWAFYTVLGRPWLTRGISPLRLTTATLQLGLPLVVLPGVPALLRTDWARVTASAWGALAFSTVFAVVIAYVVWYASVRVVGGARTAAISNLVPVVAVSAAWAWLGETLSAVGVAGAAVVLLGVWLSQVPARGTNAATRDR
jgi:drug/metabolite transporter (DMT)-like permease